MQRDQEELETRQENVQQFDAQSVLESSRGGAVYDAYLIAAKTCENSTWELYVSVAVKQLRDLGYD